MSGRILILCMLLTILSASKPLTGSATMASVVTGNTLNVTNPSSGTLALSWSFEQPSFTYFIIIEGSSLRTTVYSGQTSGTSCTVSGLPAGTYRVKVSNGAELVIIDDVHP